MEEFRFALRTHRDMKPCLRKSGMGLPHSTTLARRIARHFLPRGRGVRQPYAAFKTTLFDHHSPLDKVEMRKMLFKIPVATLKNRVLLSRTNPAN